MYEERIFTHTSQTHISEGSGGAFLNFSLDELCLKTGFTTYARELVLPSPLPTSRFFSSSVGEVSSSDGFILQFFSRANVPKVDPSAGTL